MHYLLIPYLLLGSLFVVQFYARKDVGMRTGAVVTALVTLFLLSVAIVFRPVLGDSWRYNEAFQVIRGLPFLEALDYRGTDPLFALLNWMVGQCGSAPWLLFAATFSLYLGVSWWTLRRRLSAIELSVLAMAMLAYPFFIAYGANGLRQGIGLSFLLAGYFGVREGQWRSWIWILLAPLWHSGIWLGVVVLIAHQALVLARHPGLQWTTVLAGWCLSLLLNVTDFNASIGGLLPNLVELNAGYDVYFMDAADLSYRAGFRVDFTLFSLVPLATALAIGRKGRTFDLSTPAGWMLSLYMALNAIYNLFAFAPFADRFAAFSWWLMPLVVFLQVRATASRSLMSAFVIVLVVVNAAMLQLYTGNLLQAPEWLQ